MTTAKQSTWTDDDERIWFLCERRIDAAIARERTLRSGAPVLVDLQGLGATFNVCERILDTYGSVASGWAVSIEPGFHGDGPYVKLR